jgi:hypothetical protein
VFFFRILLILKISKMTPKQFLLTFFPSFTGKTFLLNLFKIINGFFIFTSQLMKNVKTSF